ncbi:hypothetical protein H2200_000310 [Cladophialophora chaetospira]|uniref:BTB domain-containing protein n=1 Tax=Cladophialophora chaetospira TaxID=386627 RepID=A0AA38XNI6_9EURO|nr:hypothetical protein H2200_000310 [Cladophialophora chaetospira]
MDVRPDWFSTSPTVAIAVEDKCGMIRKFYIHKSLLVEQSEDFAGYLRHRAAERTRDEPTITIKSISHEAFGDFVCWLYGHLSPGTSILARLPELRDFAIHWTIPEFDGYLLRWCSEHCGPGDLIELLHILAQEEVLPHERLPDYVLAKLATPNIRLSNYIQTLIFKLAETEKLNSELRLTDPATSIHKWFPTELQIESDTE